MAEHIYEKADLIRRFDRILEMPLEAVDSAGMFDRLQGVDLQKGVVGTLIERCVLGYEPDTRQEADLVVTDGPARIKTELKSTGMVLEGGRDPHFVAKEPMSITAVGIYDIAGQDFWTSHFWAKLEHMLLVYYHYASDRPVTPYEYRRFVIKGYEFHQFTPEETAALKEDWERVRDLAAQIVSRHPGPRDRAWREAVKEEYLALHGSLRPLLNYIDLAPRFPPRFRLKKPVVSAIIAKHFGRRLEQLPGRYTVLSDIDRKCRQLTEQYRGETIGALAARFGIPLEQCAHKGIAEKIVAAMFGGTARKLSQIELFSRFGLIGKTVVLTAAGGRTEDMKLFHIDFGEMVRTQVEDEEGALRLMTFEDSALYAYFADHGFLCILFREPPGSGRDRPFAENRFVGFRRLVFSDRFIDTAVRRLWEDTRDKILNGRLADVVSRRKDGTVQTGPAGAPCSAPNFMKSRENAVFIRGSAADSSPRHKTEQVNGIRMLPQYVWIRGKAVVDELREAPEP